MPNARLAYAALDWIDAHPKLWDQTKYLSQTDCGTAGCFAGWVCLLSGEQPDMEDLEWYGDTGMLANDVSVPERALELLEAPRYAAYHDSYEDGHISRCDLFNGYNTREDLERLVLAIFGLRPTD